MDALINWLIIFFVGCAYMLGRSNGYDKGWREARERQFGKHDHLYRDRKTDAERFHDGGGL